MPWREVILSWSGFSPVYFLQLLGDFNSFLEAGLPMLIQVVRQRATLRLLLWLNNSLASRCDGAVQLAVLDCTILGFARKHLQHQLGIIPQEM